MAILVLSSNLFAAELDPLWERYIQAKITFQNELADLLVESNPEFKDLIIISRDLQVVMTKMRQQKYYYVLTYDPGRIVRDQGTSQWSNFEWKDEDNQKLLLSSADYRNLSNAKSILQEKNQGNPDWPLARKAFADVMKKERYQAILSTLMYTTASIDAELKKTTTKDTPLIN